MSLPAVALLAGGLATRLGPAAKDTPKSLVDVAGHPFLHHQLKLFASQGVTRVVVCAGHLGGQIRDYAGDGSAWGLALDYSFDGDRLLGTGGALKKALPLLSDPFFVVYGDSYLLAPLADAEQAHRASGRQALMTVYRNEGRWDRSNVEFSGGRILRYDKAATTPAIRHIDYGLGLMAHAPLRAEAAEAFDLAAFYGKLLAQGQLAGLEVDQRFYEIGSPEGLAETRAFLSRA